MSTAEEPNRAHSSSDANEMLRRTRMWRFPRRCDFRNRGCRRWTIAYALNQMPICRRCLVAMDRCDNMRYFSKPPHPDERCSPICPPTPAKGLRW